MLGITNFRHLNSFLILRLAGNMYVICWISWISHTN